MEEATFELTPNGKFILDHATSSWIAVKAVATIAIYQVGGIFTDVNSRHAVDLTFFSTNEHVKSKRGHFPSKQEAEYFVWKLTGEEDAM
jgi:hypothetical protein